MSWLPFEKDENEVRSALPDFLRYLNREIGEVYPHGLDVARPPGLFGRAGFIIAAQTAIQLILHAFAHLESETQKESQAITAILADPRIKNMAKRDFTDILLPRVQLIGPDVLTEADGVIYELSYLDVFECFTEYGDAIWPELGWSAIASPSLGQLRDHILGQLSSSGSRDGTGMWLNEALRGINCPWLPDAFWWRHLGT